MHGEGEEIRRTVALTAEDVVAANQLVARRQRLTGTAWICPLVAGIVVMAIWLRYNPTPSGILRAAAGGILAASAVFLLVWLVQIVSIPVLARRTWRETPGPRKPTDYVMSSDTLSYAQEDCSAKMAWRTLTRWSADDRCLILFNTRVTFYTLPRRDFSDDEVTRIEGWLAQAGVPRF